MKGFNKVFGKKAAAPRRLKICLAIPSTGTVCIETLLSVVGILGHTNHDFYTAYRTGCYIEQNRTQLIKTAMRENCDKIFFLDSDMLVEAQVVNKLLALNKPIVGAAYNNRSFPLYSNVKIMGPEGKFIAVPELPTEPFAAGGVPTGCMLIDIPTMLKIPEPWFDLTYFENGDLEFGEDIYFCLKAQKYGIETWCDPTIQIGHVGKYVY